ncbi:MAG: MATE family efflux transporter [Proteobacteria bacterium]|nr:MATE family efflux transporter [Pseudomonadota bacterium]
MNSFNIVDTLYISRLGTTALAALGFTMPLVMFFMGIIFGLSVGTTSALSRAYGEGDHEKVRGLATDSLVLIALLVSIASLVGYFLIDDMFLLMGAHHDIIPLIHRFMAIWYCGMTLIALLQGGNACIRATGDTHFPAAIMMLTALINIVLDPFLIFGWAHFPRMGIAGAALTLVIANSLTCAASLYVLSCRKKILSPRLLHSGTITSWRKILHVGVPSMISNMISPVSAAVIIWMVSDMGHGAVAALGITTRIEALAVVVFYALGAGVSIFTGQNYGAGNYGRIADITRIAAKYSMCWGAVIAALLWIFAKKIPLFFDQHPLVITYVTQYLHIVPISYGAMGVLITANAALNAMGKPLPATVLILLRAFGLYIPLAWLAERYYNFLGILMALFLTNIAIGLVSYLWNKHAAS